MADDKTLEEPWVCHLSGSICCHREYFGFGNTWFGQFGRLIHSLELTLEGPDPALPEGQQRIKEKGPSTIRGILNLIGRKLDLVAEYEDRVPAYVEQISANSPEVSRRSGRSEKVVRGKMSVGWGEASGVA
jgi:hypothetical protein